MHEGWVNLSGTELYITIKSDIRRLYVFIKKKKFLLIQLQFLKLLIAATLIKTWLLNIHPFSTAYPGRSQGGSRLSKVVPLPGTDFQLLLQDPEEFPKPDNIKSLQGVLGLPWDLLPHGLAWKTSERRRPWEPPHLAAVLWAPHPIISKAEPRHPMEETQSGHMYPRCHTTQSSCWSLEHSIV